MCSRKRQLFKYTLQGVKLETAVAFLEGMQSSFEDKLQGDGTYKMEIFWIGIFIIMMVLQ